MRIWEYDLEDGRTVDGGNARHGAVSHWDGPGTVSVGVKYRRLVAQAYGAECPLATCWCQADDWSQAVGVRPPVAVAA